MMGRIVVLLFFLGLIGWSLFTRSDERDCFLVCVCCRSDDPTEKQSVRAFFLFIQHTKNAVEQNRTNYYLDILLSHADFEIFFLFVSLVVSA